MATLATPRFGCERWLSKQLRSGLRALRSSTTKLGDEVEEVTQSGLAKMEYKPRKKFVKLDGSPTMESSNMGGRGNDSVKDSASTKSKKELIGNGGMTSHPTGKNIDHGGSSVSRLIGSTSKYVLRPLDLNLG